MAVDVVARGVAAQALARLPHGVEQHGGGEAASPAQNTSALRDAFLSGTRALTLAGDGYAVAAIPANDVVTLHRPSQQPALAIPKELKLLDGAKAALQLAPSLGILAAPYATYDYPEVRSYLGADVAAGASTLTLAAGEGAKWSVGDTFLYRLGSLPFDLPEPLQWGIGVVRAISGNVLTIDPPMPTPFALASVAGMTFTDEFGVAGRTNKTLHRWPLASDLDIRDLEVLGATAGGFTEQGVYVQGARRVTISRVTARNVGNGFSLQYVDGAMLDACAAIDCAAQGNPSLNKAIALAETRGVEIRDFFCAGMQQVVAAEAGAEAAISGGRFDNTGDPATGASFGAQCIAFSALGRAQLTVRDFTITGYSGYVLAEVSNGAAGYDGRVRFEGRLTLIHPDLSLSLGRLDQFGCLLDLRVGGGRELWDFSAARWFTRRIWLRGGQYLSIGLPPGILRQAKVTASAGSAPGTALTDLYIGRANDNGASYIAQLVAGQTVTLPMQGENNALFSRRSEQLKLLAITASGSALDAAGAFVDVACEIVPDLLAPAFAWSSDDDARNLGPGGGVREARVAGYDLPSIAAGATLQVDFAVPAMALGDHVLSVSFGIDRGGITMCDAQALTGACRVTFENLTATATNLAPATVRVLWRKPPSDG